MMKLNFTKTTKLFLFLFSMSILFACSSDDNGGGSATGTESSISYKVNGQAFDCNIVGYAVDINGYISVSGGFNNDSANSISFEISPQSVGSEAFYDYPVIIYNGLTYYSDYNSNVLINNTEKVQGTFSGTFSNFNGNGEVSTIAVTEGKFEIFKD
uniref:hypothetical protein n=1 Tax=Flavobacterium sp. TaxID=239 RepID=UPI00404B2CED